jgi:hypothetical protein
MQLNQPMFVLQRRITAPLGAVEHVLCDASLFGAGAMHELGNGALLEIERPFGVVFPPFGVEFTSWSAPARVRTRRAARAIKFELEINPWDGATTELLVRPRARSPYRWSGRRMRRYFGVAHATADGVTCLLRSHAASPEPARLATAIH